MKNCFKFTAIIIVFILCVVIFSFASSQGKSIIIVGDYNNISVAEKEIKVRKKLLALKEQGEFDGKPGLSSDFKVYNFASNVDKKYCESILNINKKDLPFIGIVELNSLGDPVKVLWKAESKEPHRAVKELMAKVKILAAEFTPIADEGKSKKDPTPTESPRRKPARKSGTYIAIIDFDRGDTNASPEKIAYRVRSGLIKKGNFEVISRKKLKKVLDELNISDTGLINKSEAVRLGRKLGADLVLMGEVSNFDVDRTSFYPGVYIGRVRLGRMYSVTVKLGISARLIHVGTGQILFSEQFDGYSHRESHDISYRYMNIDLGEPDKNSMTKKVWNDAMGKLVDKIESSVPLWGYVVAVEGNKILIDLGKKKKVRNGMVFQVLNIKDYKHPKTGEEVVVKDRVARIKVEKVMESVSTCRIEAGKLSNIKPGFIVTAEK
ncbi:MAG: CsgG/HfaB family protein [Candidatus Eremiobacteraeota bacterium]|nr:CsgG/HfaB family protein [Candidatus Eremiobacteraeota bacterium]